MNVTSEATMNTMNRRKKTHEDSHHGIFLAPMVSGYPQKSVAKPIAPRRRLNH